jgi:ferredoxin
MSVLHLLHLLFGAAAAVLFGLFAVTSIRENKPRAAVLGFVALIVFWAGWITLFLVFHESVLLHASTALLIVLVLAFFLPLRKGSALKVEGITVRVDERDVIFSREEYRPGSEKYEAYYAMRPENKAVDDKMRRLPELLGPGGRFHDPGQAEHVLSIFRLIESRLKEVDGEVVGAPKDLDPAVMTETLKRMALRLGAAEVGVARLDPMFVYSHVGRGPEPWGAPIENRHAFALAFTLEMGYEQVETAPRMGITEESATQYLKGAQISIAIARYLRSLGHPARAHIAGSNYQIMLPPVAHDAGLGELGRMGYLISDRLGARVRLGAVTTDLELIPDAPVVFGVQEFCATCRKCAVNCPSGAIPRGGKTVVRGVEKWPLDIEKCIHYWRQAGTDCGLCMKVCPYSHPPTFVHNVVRAGIRGSGLARTLSAWGDDLFYGKKYTAQVKSGV